MDAEFERKWSDLQARFAKLKRDDQELALEGIAQVLTVAALPREKGETPSWSITLDAKSNIAYPSG